MNATRSETARPVRHTYDSGRAFYLVTCDLCSVVLNSGHHYGEEIDGTPSRHAVRIAAEHNAREHDGPAPTPVPPERLTLADGETVPHQVGFAVFNYYDMQPGRIDRVATHAEPDTSGLLPDGLAWWVDIVHRDGHRASLDGSRLCTIETARRRGWM